MKGRRTSFNNWSLSLSRFFSELCLAGGTFRKVLRTENSHDLFYGSVGFLMGAISVQGRKF